MRSGVQVSKLSEMKRRAKNYGDLIRIHANYPHIYIAGYIKVVVTTTSNFHSQANSPKPPENAETSPYLINSSCLAPLCVYRHSFHIPS